MNTKLTGADVELTCWGFHGLLVNPARLSFSLHVMTFPATFTRFSLLYMILDSSSTEKRVRQALAVGRPWLRCGGIVLMEFLCTSKDMEKLHITLSVPLVFSLECSAAAPYPVQRQNV